MFFSFILLFDCAQRSFLRRRTSRITCTQNEDLANATFYDVLHKWEKQLSFGCQIECDCSPLFIIPEHSAECLCLGPANHRHARWSFLLIHFILLPNIFTYKANLPDTLILNKQTGRFACIQYNILI